jgi:polyisoprenoid-binding protein YceI
MLALTGSLAADIPMGTLHLEPSDTSVVFELGTTFHKVHGTMQVIEADIRFDPSAGTISGRVVVDAASALTDNKKRDRKMHQEVLESEHYPEIIFLPRGFKGELRRDGVSDIQLFGTIEIHGSAHEVQIPAQIRVSGDSITGTARFTVPYIEWGMKDPSMFIFRVKKEVDILLSFSGVASGIGVASHDPSPR